MDTSEIQEVFEAFFEKYKKTEGDRTAWSAHWTEYMESGDTVQIILTKCPKGDTFKIFKNNKKLGELNSYPVFFAEAAALIGPEWNPDIFFSSMKEMT